MLSLSKRIDYALITLAYLSEGRGRTAPAREIAEANELPPPLLMNLMKALHQQGFVRSTRGVKGGYQLAVNLEQTSLYDLILALEGPVRLVECVDDTAPAASGFDMLGEVAHDGEECRLSGHCTVRGPVGALHHRLVRFLGEVKLSEIIGPQPGERPHQPLVSNPDKTPN